MSEKEQVRIALNLYQTAIEEEYATTEKTFAFYLESETAATEAMTQEATRRLLLTLRTLHNGVFAMSQDLDWLVETSSNLASIRREGDSIVVTTSQRSSVPSALLNMTATVRATFELGGAAEVSTNEGYPGWKMNPNSELLKIATESYRRLFHKEPKILAIHAGLECGLFSEKYPGLDMISVGPTLRGVHSPDERLLIPTVQMVWDHLLDILRHV
jgi:dipeptidase D